MMKPESSRAARPEARGAGDAPGPRLRRQRNVEERDVKK